jgi:hypothetical protein
MQAVFGPALLPPTNLCEASASVYLTFQMIMCKRLMDATQSVVVIGPATDALEKSRKRRRNEDHQATQTVDEFCLQDVYDDLMEHCSPQEESFPSIEWSDSEDSEDCRTFAEHSALSRSRMFLLLPKQRENGLRRSKSFRTDLAAMNSEEVFPSDVLSLVPTTVEPISPTHCTKHLPAKEFKSYAATQSLSQVLFTLRDPIDEERIHPFNIA